MRFSCLRTCSLSLQNSAEPLLRETVMITPYVCYSKQYTGRQNTKTEWNFNRGLVLISLSGTRPWSQLKSGEHYLLNKLLFGNNVIGYVNIYSFHSGMFWGMVFSSPSFTRSCQKTNTWQFIAWENSQPLKGWAKQALQSEPAWLSRLA